MERAHKYEFEGKVRYSEIDHRATMTLPALINYFQDCSTFQSEQLGYGMDVLKKEKKAWVLAYWQVIVKRLSLIHIFAACKYIADQSF